jgi:hypothetical protein
MNARGEWPVRELILTLNESSMRMTERRTNIECEVTGLDTHENQGNDDGLEGKAREVAESTDGLSEVAAEEPVTTPLEMQEAKPVPLHWTPLSRVAFRIAFLYFFCFIFFFGNGTIFSVFPWIGNKLEEWLGWPFSTLTEWVGQHVFHLTGLAATWHPTGSGDTTLNWIQAGLFVVFAVVGGLVWSLVAGLRGNRRKEYQTLYAWLRFGLRLTCGFFMLNYGLAKVYPFQMPPISIAILNEPMGNMSPMTFLWTLIGMNPIYEMVCGAAEVLGGLLFLFRRTALVGALFSAFVMSNVVLYNFFFDVPVKLFASNLLLACLFVVLPDVKPLFSFFVLHRPAAPVGIWVPPASRKWMRITMVVVECVFGAAFVLGTGIGDGIGWFHHQQAIKVHTPLAGAWQVDKAHPATGSFVTGEGLPATNLYIDSVERAFTRASDGALWRTYLDIDAKAHTIEINDFPTPGVKYSYQLADNDHLTLTPVPPEKPKPDPKAKAETQKPTTAQVVTLTRIPIPSHYPLLDRGFHLVNQWGLER